MADAVRPALALQCLEAAREIIVQRGYRAATVDAIARTAGVHVDTVYELMDVSRWCCGS